MCGVCGLSIHSGRVLTRVTVSGCMFMFGLTTTLQGLTQNYSGLIATRFFLGAYLRDMTSHL